MAEGWATFTLAPKQSLEPHAVRDLVEDAGMTLSGIRIEANGEVIEQQGQPALRVSGSQQVFALQSNDKTAELAQAMKTGRSQVSVTGTFPVARGKKAASLVVNDFQLR